MVDVLTTLLMVILLCLMFFVLNFLMNRNVQEYPENTYHGYYDDDGYDYNDHDGDDEPSPSPSPSPTPTVYDNGGGGGGDNDPGSYEIYGEGEGHDRCAVYAELIDEETGKTIEVPGVTFELYSHTKSKLTLTTHYPVPVSYTEFVTTEGGWFFLPEKIRMGDYYFHQITEIPGYDYAADEPFTVEEVHEWDDPLVVYIPVGAAKNNIQVQINDKATKSGLKDVVFNVVADGDITTYDGTIRYSDGEVVTSIECDSTGYGLSEDLYLGDYILVPTTLPYGYAAPELESRKISLPRREAPGEYAPIMEMESDVTTVIVNLKDELYESNIQGIELKLSCDSDAGEERVFTSNGNGIIEISSLKKNATYTLTEESMSDSYQYSGNEYKFTVDTLGNINDEARYTLDINYRMIRIEINTIDKVLRGKLTGYNVSLINEKGELIDTWVSDGTTHTIDGIEVGKYTLQIEDSDDVTTINIEDTKDVQKFNATVMTTRSYAILVGIGAIILMALIVAVTVVVSVIRKKREARKA